MKRKQDRDGKQVVDSPDQVEARFERLVQMGQVPADMMLRAAPERAAEARHRTLERIIDETNDLQSASFLSLGARTVQTTARISTNNRLRRLPIGTGFLVSPRLLMTNNHVLSDPHEASRAVAEFNFELDADSVQGTVAGYRLEPDVLFLTDAHLDYTLVALAPLSDGRTVGDEFGWNRLMAQQGKIIIGESLNVVGHPMGRLKEITIRSGTLQFQHDEFLQYTTDTEPGNSGSPIYNDQWEIVALHHAGVPSTDAEGNWLKRDGSRWLPTDGDDAVHWVANEGARISVLLDHISEQPVDDPARGLLEEMLVGTGRVIGSRPSETDDSAAPQAESERITVAVEGTSGVTARRPPRNGVNVVFLHGRGQESRDPRRLRRMWTAGLGKGLVLADMDPIDARDVWFPFYGDVLVDWLGARERLPDFDTHIAAAAVAPSDASARELYEALVTEAAERAGYPQDADAREGMFDRLLGGLQRRLSWLADRSRLDELVIAAIFRDVAAYLSSATVRDAVLDTVLAGVPRSGEIVLVSHSLGTVVAMDLVTRLPDAIDVALLVTAGSPLGMDTVFNRLLTKGPHRPSEVGDWVNVWSPADPVAIGCPLTDDWGRPLVEVITDNATNRAHAIDEYLADVRVARAIGAAL
ncbi:MAG TPA: serine protease [Euzebyales bacterium]|nr:serine protease [Euzebyales bacterium]